MAVKPLWISPPQFEDANGNPYSGALLFFYAAGSSTKQNAYTTSSGGTPTDNPMTLNSSGYPAMSGTVIAPWGTVGQTYKIGLAAPGSADPPASFIWTVDGISPINDTSVTQDEWVSGPAPTYIGATSFSLVGDQTSTFQVGRRVKTTNSGGTIYSVITASAFGAVTTVTVLNDSGTLDAGLSAVSYGLLSATNPSLPNVLNTTFTATLTGCTTTPTYTVYYTKNGNLVTLMVSPAANITATSDATGKTLTGMPAAIRPARTIPVATGGASDNGTPTANSTAEIASTGVISLYASNQGAAWTSSGTFTFFPFCATYTIA